ncbi:MAG TPA: autotransporter-associated beta strand repeat-containing protein [Tepidisphaeraceae bacterium]|nr:autotransporter-associated beta strand repeat-containing protein [Tepidisphaeraceae bacterium]
MKRTNRRSRIGRRGSLIASSVFAVILPAAALAQSLTWDASGNHPTSPNDGSGNWDTSSAANWSNGSADSVWSNGDIAVFGAANGAAGTVLIDDPSGGVIASGITFNAPGSGNYNISANANDSLTLAGAAAISVNYAGSPTISATISGTSGLTYSTTGLGTLILAGSNSYTGTTSINSGTIVVGPDGSLGNAGNAVQLGTPEVAGGTATTSAGNLVLNNNVTIGTFSNLTAGNGSTVTNLLTISSGSTLTDTGNFIVGAQNTTTNATVYDDTLNVSGGGSLNVSGTFSVGQASNNSGGKDATTLSLAGLNQFTLAGNELAVGYGANDKGILTLANTTVGTSAPVNYINVGEIDVGNTVGGGNNPGASILLLGSGANTMDSSYLNIGIGKGQGTIAFVSSSSGTANISTTYTTIGEDEAGTGPSSGSALLLAGHNTTFNTYELVAGEENGNTGGSAASGVVTFDTGTFNAYYMYLATVASGTASTGASGIFTMGGASPNSTATGVLNLIYGPLVLGDNTDASVSAAATATFVMNGGTAHMPGIEVYSTSGTTISTLTLAGGTLDLEGNGIGGTGSDDGDGAITNINMPSGTQTAVLENLGELGINEAGLKMNGTGTLVLDGVNSFSGLLTISSGTVQVGQAGDTTALTEPVGETEVTNNSTLNFASSQSATVAVPISGSGVVNQIGSGVTILQGTDHYSGATTINAGTLSVEGYLYSGIALPGSVNVQGGTLAGAGIILSGVNLASGAIMPDAGGTALRMSSLKTTGGTLLFELNGSSMGEINVAGTADLAAGSIAFGVIAPGTQSTYTILIAGSLINQLSLAPVVDGPRDLFTPSLQGNSIVVNVSAGTPGNLVWNNSGNSAPDDGMTWDIQTNNNWTGTAAAGSTTQFYNGDNVTFNDNNNGHYAVNVAQPVSPGSVTFDNNAAAYTITGAAISGSTALTVNGTGGVTLLNSNSYTGATSVNGGTLTIGSGAAIASSSINVASPATLNVAAGASIGTSATLLDNGNFIINDSQTVGALGGSGTLTINPTGTLNVTNGGAFSGVATGGGALSVSGNLSATTLSSLNLSGLNSFQLNDYSGILDIGTSIRAATVTLANTTSGGNAPYNSVYVGTLDVGGATPGSSALLFGSGNSYLFTASINIGSGAGQGTIGFIPSSGGYAEIYSENSYEGTDITVSSQTAAGGAGSILNLAGYNASVYSDTVLVGNEAGDTSGNAETGTITFDTGFFGAFYLDLGVVTSGTSKSGAVGNFIFGGATPNNTSTAELEILYGCDLGDNTDTSVSAPATANLVINGGTTEFLYGGITNASTSGTTSANLTLAGGTLDLGGYSIGGSGAVNSGNGPVNITWPTAGESATVEYVGSINGTGGVTLNGGTLTVAGSNEWTGPTAVNSGLLNLDGNGTVLGDTAISVAAGATLAVQGAQYVGIGSTTTSGASLNLAAGSTLNMVDGVAGGLTLYEASGFLGPAVALHGATLDFDLVNAAADDLIVNGPGVVNSSGANTINVVTSGAIAPNVGTYQLISDSNGFTGSGTFGLAGNPIVNYEGVNYTYSLSHTSTSENLVITAPHYARAMLLSDAFQIPGTYAQFNGEENPAEYLGYGETTGGQISLVELPNGYVIPGFLNNISASGALGGPRASVFIDPFNFTTDDDEVIALALTVTDQNGTHEITPEELTAVIADLDATIPAGTMLAEPFDDLPGSAQDPLAEGENLFDGNPFDLAFVIPGGLSGDQTFSVDFSNENVDGITSIQVTDIGVIPEPASCGLMLLGMATLLTRRRRRN